LRWDITIKAVQVGTFLQNVRLFDSSDEVRTTKMRFVGQLGKPSLPE
jgi:hypothetical protein